MSAAPGGDSESCCFGMSSYVNYLFGAASNPPLEPRQAKEGEANSPSDFLEEAQADHGASSGSPTSVETEELTISFKSEDMPSEAEREKESPEDSGEQKLLSGFRCEGHETEETELQPGEEDLKGLLDSGKVLLALLKGSNPETQAMSAAPAASSISLPDSNASTSSGDQDAALGSEDMELAVSEASGAEEAEENTQVGEDATSGLQGFCAIRAGHLPMSLAVDPWRHLVRPLLEVHHAKAFVGAEVFTLEGGGLSLARGGARPQVLIDRQDRGILAMFKPAGWATCSTPYWEGNEGNLIRHVWQYLDTPHAAPCHRLDRGTSGIVLVATSKLASKYICQQICSKALVKQYIGLCRGQVTPAAGAFCAPLALSETDKPLGTCAHVGRPAITRYRVIGYFEGPNGSIFSLLQVQIDHGRQHQIRLHMASLGHPIVADTRYNSSQAREDAKISPRLFLHACYLHCQLPPSEHDGDPEEPFTVACRLPLELKHTLLSVLKWKRQLDSELTPDAARLCQTLLSAEHAVTRDEDAESLYASRLVIRRRDHFVQEFGFNQKERAEISRILATLPTAQERCNALQQFRVLGIRTPDFIVGRFAKYVDGLTRWRRLADKDAKEEPRAESLDEATSPDNEEAGSESSPSSEPSPTDKETGHLEASAPLQMQVDMVWCEVCQKQECQVTLHTPSLALRIRRSVPVPGTSLGLDPEEAWCTEPRGCKGGKGAGKAGLARKPTKSWVAVGKGSGKGGKSPEAPPEPAEAPAPEVEEEEDDSLKEKKRKPRKTKKEKAPEQTLMQLLRDYVAEEGGSVEGGLAANKVAAGFNQHIRNNSRRNDGSLRKWIGTIPGLTVEHCGHNRWKVHLA